MAHPCRRAQNTGTCTEPASYAIPDMYWSDVVLEFGIGDTVNDERQPVIFAGSINNHHSLERAQVLEGGARAP
jgi:hypothetical protein